MVHVDTSISKFCYIGIDRVCVLVGSEYLSLPDMREPGEARYSIRDHKLPTYQRN